MSYNYIENNKILLKSQDKHHAFFINIGYIYIKIIYNIKIIK